MRSLPVTLLIVSTVLACAGVGERTDTTKILPVDDINARDTSPTPPPARIDRLSLLDSFPAGGLCTVRRYRANFDQAREVTYETNSPPRTYVMEIGRGARRFLPVSLDIRATRVSATRTETENVYVGFTPEGSVSVGTRRYSASGAATANDRGPLGSSDSAIVIAFAKKILDMCDTGR